MRPLCWLAAGILWAGATPALAAGKITSMSLGSSQAAPGRSVQVTLGHAGPTCGYKLLLGDGSAIGPKAAQGASVALTISYASSGSFSVSVVGKKKGNHPACVLGAGVQPVSITVGGAAPRSPNLGSKADAIKESLADPAPTSPFGTKAAEGADALMPDVSNLTLRPRLESVFFVAGPVGTVSPAVLAPGGRVYVKGKRFGSQKGALFLTVKGAKSAFPQYPSGEVPLGDLSWSHDEVNGKIPLGMTGPLESADVEVRLRRADQAISNGLDRQFAVPVETRILKGVEGEVRLIECGDAHSGGGCMNHAEQCTLDGFHNNLALTTSSTNRDRYKIDLEDGWTLRRVAAFEKTITGDDGDYSKLTEPVQQGATSWFGAVESYTSSDDRVSYCVKIEIQRPKGAY